MKNDFSFKLFLRIVDLRLNYQKHKNLSSNFYLFLLNRGKKIILLNIMFPSFRYNISKLLIQLTYTASYLAKCVEKLGYQRN